MSNNSRFLVPENLPFLFVTDGVVLPGATLRIPCRVSQNVSVIEQYVINATTLRHATVGIAYQRMKETKDGLEFDGYYDIGVAAVVTQVVGTNRPRPSYTVQLTGICRVRIGEPIAHKPCLYAKVTQLDKFPGKIVTIERNGGDVDTFLADVKQLIDLLPKSVSVVQLKKIAYSAPIDHVVDLIGAVIEGDYGEKLKVLFALDLNERLNLVHDLVKRQLQKYRNPNDDGGGKFTVEVFPESVKVDDIAKALINGLINRDFGFVKSSVPPGGNRGDGKGEEEDTLEMKIKKANMPPSVEKVAMEELKKMKMASQQESPLIRQYLELLVDLPWSIETKDSTDLKKARQDLDEDHFGLQTVKKRVLEYLAVKRMQNSLKGPILCFVGPPGVGKTSIARSIARTLGRKFYRISLGGISDQTDIRGFNRTYVASMPGRIIGGLKGVRSKNPVFLLDEVDKIHSGIRGDPAAALLEVLDPEQNFQFVDHYLNVPFDLSHVLFVATANSAAEIPAALADRMEIINIPGYTPEEKLSIAQKYLVPKLLRDHGLTEEHVVVPEKCLMDIVQLYTREAGVRNLERRLGAIMRAVALKVAEHIGSKEITSSADSVKQESDDHAQRIATFPVVIDEHALEDILGQPLYRSLAAEQLSTPGVAAGLAWTVFGGEIMYVEATKMDGEGKLTLTGQLGDVMKESASVALNWLRSHAAQLGVTTPHGMDLLDKTDIHIHFPAGAVSKDGPSAGVTVLAALASLFTGRCVRSDTAMTGEITLRSLVLPVGGVKEKLLAAHRAGFTRVILPKRNLRDVADAGGDVTGSIEIVPVVRIEDVLNAAFEGTFPRLAKVESKL